MIGHMRHMGNSGKIAIAAFLAAVALLVLTVVTLHEAVLMWFLAASATAYIACVAEVIVRRRHKTLVASGVGTILCVAFGIAFMRQWGLAFNPDPAALTAPVTTNHPDLYFYLAAGLRFPPSGVGPTPRNQGGTFAADYVGIAAERRRQGLGE